MSDVLLFGATGYTGRLTAEALARQGVDFAVAGRDRAKLEALAHRTGASGVHIAAVGDADALVTALRGARVLVTCVGPFAELGDTAIEAALRAGVHYIDSTGELTFIERLVERDDARARQAGIALAPALGFDEVPADVAATMACEGLERPDVVLTYAVASTGSFGTIRTALQIAAVGARWRRDGRVEHVRTGSGLRWAPMPPPLGPRPTVAAPMASGVLVPLHIEARSLQTYMTAGHTQRAAMKVALPLLGSPLRTSVVRRGLERLLPSGKGPSDQQRHAGKWTILAEGRSASGWRNVTMTGRDVYGLTAEFLAAGALRMLEPDFEARGLIPPVQALGSERWQKVLADLGVSIETFGAR